MHNDDIFTDDKSLGTTVDLLPADVVKKIEMSNPGVEFFAVETPCGVAAFKAISEKDWDRYQAFQQEQSTIASSNKMVVLGSLLYPDKEVFLGWVKRKPGMVLTLSNKISEFSGYQGAHTLVTKKYGNGS